MNIGVFFGGKSVEHDVSIITGTQFIENADSEKYDFFPIYISRDGRWYFGQELSKVSTLQNFDPSTKGISEVFLTGLATDNSLYTKGRLGLKEVIRLDAAVLAMHGMNGEDGTLQGLLELCEIPYTSAGVTGSAAGMDKIIMKAAFAGLGFPVLDWCFFERDEWEKDRPAVLQKITSKLQYPMFIKPANLGSSIGINKAASEAELTAAIEVAINYDSRILVEKAVEDIMEINCAVLGNGIDAIASLCEQPVTWKEFLTFDEKYMRGESSKGMQSLARKIPADIPSELTKKIQDLSLQVFSALDLKGVVRIDYIIDKAKNELFINEVNTIPGSFAFYLFEPMGISFKELSDRLIKGAINAQRQKQKNSYAFDSKILQKVNTGAKGAKIVK